MQTSAKTKQIKSLYNEFRAAQYPASQALRSAKVVATFHALEEQGLVRIEQEYENENYFDVYGHENAKQDAQIAALIDKWGMYYVKSEVYNNETEEWELADGIGMCIYKDATSYLENSYIPDLMAQAIKALDNLTLQVYANTAQL